MTSKYFILSLCLCIFSITVMGQEKNYDRDVDGLRVCSGENDTVFNYETLSGQKLIVYSSCLDFCMGRDSLNAYVRRMFRIRTDYESITFENESFFRITSLCIGIGCRNWRNLNLATADRFSCLLSGFGCLYVDGQWFSGGGLEPCV